MSGSKQLILAALTGFLAAVVIILLLPNQQGDNAAATPGNLLSEDTNAGYLRQSYADAVAKAQPGVVNIYTSKTVRTKRSPFYNDPFYQFFFRDNPTQKRTQSSLGSGVIVSAQGYILTNNHVIAGADEIRVGLSDGREALASVVGTDPETDLAVLHINVPDLPTISFAPENVTPRIGDIVLAIGNPFNVGQTVTQGIVSAIGRNNRDLSNFVSFIQTDAAINPGNSGGALVNSNGDLIGINTAIFSKSGGYQGIGYAIPVKLANKVLLDIVDHGSVVRGWLGIEPQILSEALAKAIGIDFTSGILVTGVFKNGPAHQAGILPGDIITQINGSSLADPRRALSIISDMPPGETVSITVMRRGESHTVNAVVGTRPKAR